MKKVLQGLILVVAVLLSVNGVFAAKQIVDVTGGEELRGVSTPANAGGNAYINYEDGVFTLHAELHHLSDPVGDDFYEGWLVQRSPFMFISTGVLEKEGDVYINHFSSDVDYTSYDFYVLTLEPNDGDPAPADHIVEGDAIVGKMMMKDKMIEKKDMMMKDTMMKGMMMRKELTPVQKAIRGSIKNRLEKLDVSRIDTEVFLEKIEAYKARVASRNISEAKKQQIYDVIEVIIDVIAEKQEMMSDTMMEK